MANIISVRVNKAENEILNDIAAIHNCGVSSLIKKIVFERLEEEYDLKAIAKYEKDKIENTLETRPIEELFNELGL